MGTIKLAIFMPFFLVLAACTVISAPLTSEDLQSQITDDKTRLTADQEPVAGPITLPEAIARALSYNLDLRLALLEKDLAERQLDLARYDQLPEFVTNLAYTGRDKFSGATSQSLITGAQSLEASTSAERDIFTADLGLTWNILDFGVSYIRAKQGADRVLIAEEQKRRVINRIIQEVRTAYWRAVSNDRLIERQAALMVRVTKAIEESRKIEEKRLEAPLTALTYQRELIGIKRELQELQRELSLAKIQLAALMNLPPGQEYELAIPERTRELPEFEFTPRMMEQLALEQRSELREVAYQKRINAQETRAAILGLLPGLNLNFSENYSSNSFLFHNDWLSYGAQISWNLLNVFKLPATRRTVEAQDRVLDARRLALSMAVMTQVHVSLAQIEHAKSEFMIADEFNEAQARIMEQVYRAARTNAVSEQVVIREEMNSLVSEVKYDVAYADLENAYANAYQAMGIDQVPAGLSQGDVGSLTRLIQQNFDRLKSGYAGISYQENTNPENMEENELIGMDVVDVLF